jgi:hypothetical protein
LNASPKLPSPSLETTS